ncbi:hypothetical protein D3C86_1668000 [compost metagenome]
MPLKIFEKVSPFLKFKRPSSEVREEALPPLAVEMKSGSAPRTDQLAPIDSAESNCASSSPTLNVIAWTGATQPSATATASAHGWKLACLVFVVMRLSWKAWLRVEVPSYPASSVRISARKRDLPCQPKE